MTQKTGDNKKEGDIRVKVDKQGGKGVKQSAMGEETIEGWRWRYFVNTGFCAHGCFAHAGLLVLHIS